MWDPLLRSLQVAGLATVLATALGIAIAFALVRWKTPAAGLLDAVAHLPLVLPPTVLGYYLLVALGARSPLGAWLEEIGLPLVFTWRGAVVAAMTVSLPLVVQSSRAAFESIHPELGDVARTLGHSEVDIFLGITLPLAWRGVLAGSMLAFSRALGEFGATLMVAGNIPGRTQTLPLAIYDAAQTGDRLTANGLALLLTATAVLALAGIRRLGRRIVRDDAA
jgi:molybdate transport system permease protein